MRIKIFFVVVCVVFLFHFTMTALYVLPFNPIKNKLNNLNVFYMEPLFTQNWKLFAPNPLSNNYYVYIQVKDPSGKKSKWIDISTPLYEANHTNRFSPVNKLVRIGTSAFMQSVHSDELLDKIEQRKKELDHQQSKVEKNNVNKEIKHYQEDGKHQLYNFGYFYVEKQFKKQNIHKIRIRVLREEPIPFSKRNDKNYKIQKSYITYDWEPVQGGIVSGLSQVFVGSFFISTEVKADSLI